MGDTRQDILDTSLELFAEQGYEKTSLRQIAEAVGVTKAALYYHFPSKQELLLALFEPVAALQDELLEEMRDETLLDTAAWLPALERMLAAILDNRRLWALLERNASTLMELQHEGPFAEAHQELHRRTEALFADDRLSIEARVRLASAFGAIFGAVEVAGSRVFEESPADELRPMVSRVVRDILAPVVTAPSN
jgi:AcrR family transcriptional regulator